MKWNVSVLRRSGECERTEVADFELSEFFNRIASAEGKAWVLSVERVGDVGDSALVEPDGDELVSQLDKRKECLRQEVEEMEAATPSLSEGVRTLWKARSDGSREEELGSAIEGLRGRISDLSSQIADCNELPGDWEYDRKGGYVYCAFA